MSKESQEKLIGLVDSLQKMVGSLIKIVDENFSEVKIKIDALEAKIDSLDNNTDKNFKEVKWELKKIQDVTKYADEFLNIPTTGQA